MVELTAPSKRTVILSLTAVVGIVTVSSLAYILYRDSKRSNFSHRFHTTQRNLNSQLTKAQGSLKDLIDNDLRHIQIRTKTLRTHRLHPGDDHVKLPSLGLINEEEKEELGDEIEETKEELIQERAKEFGDHANVRQGYKDLDLKVKALHKKMVRLLEQVNKVDLSELSEIGDEAGGISQENESEILVLEKLRKRRSSILSQVQQTLTKLERIQASYKERMLQIKEYEKMDRIGLAPEDDVEPTTESEMMKQGITFADVAAMNVPEPEVLAPTEDLEKMKQGITFADAAKQSIEEPEALAPTEDLEKMKKGVSFADVAKQNIEEPEVLAPTEDLEKMKKGVSFADVAKQNIEEPEVLAPTEDLEKMKQGISFADMAKQNIEEPEVLAPTEDLQKMKEGVSFADVAKQNVDNVEEPDVLAPTEDLEKMKHGISFADVTKNSAEE
ncbi:hypothetical protein BX616_010438 [Lobosporangium transversale]|uniref:Uncharacterized protein n=1 Tax=Lobosporangium transversale TaxID=64571 RepID=A0A1Y2GKY5_9FUNG|nr:hypothetical protein BCR41DRAFT_354693 [Lobosporangium transversale]KAF9912020.1 hypothetical protein BX616_010438 [Lobosporangium transversale]ORZ14333.1 hypothetical protein BCR41DRAFT_354693 [Lobosporangium transversale]|eukprot:XP_021880811.1 hypothetical protein BCR41DRAFT_354693 [Lobosporangium transversale]